MQNRPDVRFYIMYLIGRCGYPAERALLIASNRISEVVVAVELSPSRRAGAKRRPYAATEPSPQPRGPSRVRWYRQARGAISSPIASRS